MARIGQNPIRNAVGHMRVLIRDRQNAIADFHDEEMEDYDWEGELSKRWLPSTGLVFPATATDHAMWILPDGSYLYKHRMERGKKIDPAK